MTDLQISTIRTYRSSCGNYERSETKIVSNKELFVNPSETKGKFLYEESNKNRRKMLGSLFCPGGQQISLKNMFPEKRNKKYEYVFETYCDMS